jgi:hypothetical protein
VIRARLFFLRADLAVELDLVTDGGVADTDRR